MIKHDYTLRLIQSNCEGLLLPYGCAVYPTKIIHGEVEAERLENSNLPPAGF